MKNMARTPCCSATPVGIRDTRVTSTPPFRSTRQECSRVSPANSVQHHIDVSEPFVEGRSAVVDHIVSPEAANELRIARRRRGQHASTSPMRQLYCQGPHPTGAAVDQHALSGRKACVFEECLPSRQRRKRQRRRLYVRDAAWLQR